MSSLDALDSVAFRTAAARLAPGPLAILNEGLLIYLDDAEKSRLAANVREALGHYGGVWITADVYVRGPTELRPLAQPTRAGVLGPAPSRGKKFPGAGRPRSASSQPKDSSFVTGRHHRTSRDIFASPGCCRYRMHRPDRCRARNCRGTEGGLVGSDGSKCLGQGALACCRWVRPKQRGIMISRASSDDWARHYEAARKRRHAGPGDPLEMLVKRNAVREKIFLIGSSVFRRGAVRWSLLLAVGNLTDTGRGPRGNRALWPRKNDAWANRRRRSRACTFPMRC